MSVEVDQAIISGLVEDARATVKSLAARAGVSEATTRARLRHLTTSGRVTPSILVHPEVEGEEIIYMVRARVREGVPAESVLGHEAFASSPWAAQSARTGVLYVQLAADSMTDLAEGLELASAVPDVEELTYTVMSSVLLGANWEPAAESEQRWAPAPTRVVDDIDRALIQALRADGRASYTHLAQVGGLTIAATRRRVLRLVGDGVIRFATLIGDAAAAAAEASVDVVVGAADMQGFVADAVALPQVRYVSRQSGDFPIACYVVAPTTPELATAVAALVDDARVRRSSVDPFVVLLDRISWSPH